MPIEIAVVALRAILNFTPGPQGAVFKTPVGANSRVGASSRLQTAKARTEPYVTVV
jgi:hypothetical protein